MTWQDQQHINAFSRLNSTYSDLVEELRLKKEERESLDDLSMELELVDDEDEKVLYRIADTFIALPHADAMQRLESDQRELDQQLDTLSVQIQSHDEQMKSLKVQLYAKFGDNISTY